MPDPSPAATGGLARRAAGRASALVPQITYPSGGTLLPARFWEGAGVPAAFPSRPPPWARTTASSPGTTGTSGVAADESPSRAPTTWPTPSRGHCPTSPATTPLPRALGLLLTDDRR